jgi:hypothetical protein
MERASEHADQVSRFRLGVHPMAEFLPRDGGEADVHAQLVRLQQQVGEQRRRLHLVGQLH